MTRGYELAVDLGRSALCGCPYIEDTTVVGHTVECLQRQRQEDQAREVGAGLVAFGHLLAANPDLVAAAPFTTAAGTTNLFIYGNDRRSARANIELFIAAFRADQWSLAEYTSGNHVGVQATKYGMTVRVLTDPKDLADEPQPPAPVYRPLLAPADEPQAVTR
jgi:hypothetical protein